VWIERGEKRKEREKKRSVRRKKRRGEEGGCPPQGLCMIAGTWDPARRDAGGCLRVLVVTVDVSQTRACVWGVVLSSSPPDVDTPERARRGNSSSLAVAARPSSRVLGPSLRLGGSLRRPARKSCLWNFGFDMPRGALKGAGGAPAESAGLLQRRCLSWAVGSLGTILRARGGCRQRTRSRVVLLVDLRDLSEYEGGEALLCP
jgi:hypothetical protein